MQLVSKMDELVYDYYINENYNLRKRNDKQQLRDVVHYFYRGVNTGSEFVNTLDSSPQTKLLQKSTKGSIMRSMNALEHVIESIGDTPIDDIDEDTKSKIRNKLGAEESKEALKNREFAMSQVESLVGVEGKVGPGIAKSGSGEGGDYKARRNLISDIMYNPRVKSIIELYGQLLTHMNKVKRERRFPDATNIVDVTLGRDLSKLVLPEKLGIASEELELLSNYKFASNQLLQYKTEAVKETSKGDFTIMVDTSGSTLASFEDGLNILDVEVAFAMAVCRFAIEDKRKVKVYTFSGSTTLYGEASKPVHLMPIFENLLRLSPYGGTNAQRSLEIALGASDDASGDIMMLTDGLFKLDRPLNKGPKRIISGLISVLEESGLGIDSYSRNQFDGFFRIQNLDDVSNLSLELI